MGSADYLHERAQDLLDDSLLGLAAARTGHAVPSRVYVSHGTPAVDVCEGSTGQLTVHLFPSRPIIMTSLAKDGRRQCLVRLTANFRVQVWRCALSVDDDGPVGATALGDIDEVLSRDLWSLLTYLHAQRAAGQLFDGVSTCDVVTIGEPRLLEESGLAAGWEVPVTLDLNDAGP